MNTKVNRVPDYVPIERAKNMPGLRIAFTRGMPGPWGIAARAIFDIKGIDYIAVPQEAGGANEVLKEWTGQTSAPVAMLNDDRPRIQWSEMLVLAEQMQPEPRLIPAEEDDRTTMFGICHELCGDDGLGWNSRLLMSAPREGPATPEGQDIFRKYASPVTVDHCRRRVTAILGSLARRLETQAAAGSRYLVGQELTAADIYSAAFSNLFKAFPEELCIMPDFYRVLAPAICAQLSDPVPQIWFDHREHVVRTYFPVPIAM